MKVSKKERKKLRKKERENERIFSPIKNMITFIGPFSSPNMTNDEEGEEE
jgi:hypothetical protein